MEKAKKTSNLIRINSKYQPIVIGSDTLDKIYRFFDFGKYSQVAILTDAKVATCWGKVLQKGIGRKAVQIIALSGEKNKNISQVSRIWQEMHRKNLDRHSLLLNLGGGLICDIGGFTASTYMRGIDFLNVPTTLLSQADASVGGKTGINLLGAKNLIGTFSQPKATIIDVMTLTTLPRREFTSGFAEIIKHGLIKDRKYFKLASSKPPSKFTTSKLKSLIAGSLRIKMSVVSKDEKEKNRRKILNFGHTIGHAVESLSLNSPSPFLHGEAVAIGIMAEAIISNLTGKLPLSSLKTIRQALTNAGLPVKAVNIRKDKVLKIIKSDKKNKNGVVNFTLIDNIGQALYNRHVSQTIIIKALKQITNK